MSTTVTNKTHKPLSVPLPGGKKLHLGPNKSGQIASNDADHPAVKALVDSGALEIVGKGGSQGPGSGGGTKPTAHAPQGHAAETGGRRSGDR